MKLCTTIQSERGKPVQKTGNEYMDIRVTDDNGEEVATLIVSLSNDTVGNVTRVQVDFAPHVYVNGMYWLDSEITKR